MSASHYLVSLVFGAGREASAVVVMETVVKLCCGKQRVIRITLTLVCTFSRTNQKRAEGRTVSRQPRVMHKSGDRSQRVRTNHSSPQTHTHTHTVSARLTDLCRYCRSHLSFLWTDLFTQHGVARGILWIMPNYSSVIFYSFLGH